MFETLIAALLLLSALSIGPRNHLIVSECNTEHTECVDLFWLFMGLLLMIKE